MLLVVVVPIPSVPAVAATAITIITIAEVEAFCIGKDLTKTNLKKVTH
jgi:hypothetical protein